MGKKTPEINSSSTADMAFLLLCFFMMTTTMDQLGFNPTEDSLEEAMATSVCLPGESHGQRGLAGYSPCGHKELDTTEQLSHVRLKMVTNKHNELYK